MEEGERTPSDTDFSVSAKVHVGLIARNKHDCLRPRGGGRRVRPPQRCVQEHAAFRVPQTPRRGLTPRRFERLTTPSLVLALVSGLEDALLM